MNARLDRLLRPLLLSLLLPAWASAQDDATGVATDDLDPLAWIGAHEIESVATARSDGVHLRSGPDPHYKVVRTVRAGEPLVIVARSGGYLGVLVPAGYTAFVHGRYVEVDELSVGRITTSRVNLRSVPTSREDYPIGQLDAGAEVWVWGPAEGNEQWLEVTPPTDLPLWVAAEDVVAGATLDDEAVLSALVNALDERRLAFEERNAEARAALEARRAGEAALEAARSRAAELLVQLEAERGRGADADYSAVREEVTVLEATEDEDLDRTLVRVMSRIERYELERDQERERVALVVRIEEEKRRLEEERVALLAALEEVSVEEAVRVGTDGEWTGFVRIRPFGPSQEMRAFALEQGTKIVAWLTSPEGRYRLPDFAGRPMRARGRIVAQEGARPVVEITRLEQALR